MVEVIRDRAVALPPLNGYLARDLIRRTRASLALQPLRGAPAAAQEAIEDILLRVSEIVCELPDVGAIDINPVVVTAKGAVVVDARIGVMPEPQPAVAVRPHGDPSVSGAARVPAVAGRTARPPRSAPSARRTRRSSASSSIGCRSSRASCVSCSACRT